MPTFQIKSQLVKAGAGTGKTKCLVNEVYSLFKQFRDYKHRIPKLIVCTFTKKASQELKERLFRKALEQLSEINIQNVGQQRPLSPPPTKKNLHSKAPFFQTENKPPQDEPALFLHYIQSPFLHISTIDGILNMFLKRYGHRFDLSPDFQLFHGGASKQLFDSLAEEFVFKKNFSLLQKLPYPFLKEIFLFYFKCRLKYGEVSFYSAEDFKDFKNDNKSMRLFKDEKSFQASHFVPLFEEFRQAGEELFLNFMEKKKKKALLDMDDLLLFSLSLLRESPQTAKDFSKEWDYWLIDEYQDTSWIQEQIIDKMTGFKNVFCVGDPGQSIYLFRGADPDVFKRREQALNGSVKTLSANYRSAASLIHFYNDFFPTNREFIKFNPAPHQKIDLKNPCVYLLTSEKSNKSQSLRALSSYIQQLITSGAHYSDLAILSSKNETLMEIATYLRNQNIPLMLYSTSFVNKRLILDALFLLKFLINPFDNTNLKALLRAPYFYLSDQDLADSSYKHLEFCKNEERTSFWSFIKEHFKDRICIKSLKSYLKLVNKKGLVKSFENALIDSGFMELSHFHDPTGSSEANLWKLISLLNQNSSSALKIFYSFLGKDDEENQQEAPACENNKAIEIMTIHKSKGLEFKHVIIMDFSISQSSLKSKQGKEDIIYDNIRKKMAFSVPIGRRDSSKIKSYAHVIYNDSKKMEPLMEKDRLFYVAMTRAKQTLAFFIPNNAPPEQNSWLDRVSFFEKQFVSRDNKILLEKQYDEKNTTKLKSWNLNDGLYKTDRYCFCVKSSESIK